MNALPVQSNNSTLSPILTPVYAGSRFIVYFLISVSLLACVMLSAASFACRYEQGIFVYNAEKDFINAPFTVVVDVVDMLHLLS